MTGLALKGLLRNREAQSTQGAARGKQLALLLEALGLGRSDRRSE